MGSTIPPIVVMGVQGSGKSTIGSLLAQRLGVAFIDGDTLHSKGNVASMAAGNALTDEQRMPWLHEVGRALAGRDGGIVVACSALKRSYRDLLRSHAPGLFVVDPEGSMELVAARITARQHEYMPPALLQSQYDTLEPLEADEHGVTVDIAHAPVELIDTIVEALSHPAAAGRASVAH
ncbi:MAG: putative gluconokinase/dehydrogenase [Microbacteriaceae bacterium]|nr:putative gluconokinase/dehydrogenase [Microbacteriaceae bacterium]HEV7957366.1 gluconokinase [Marisediminicola sp.]